MNTKFRPETNEFEEYGALEYTNPRVPLVSGPTLSRRLGMMVTVNVLGSGQKVCSFDCPYCELGSTEIRLNRIKTDVVFPTLEQLTEEMRAGFEAAHRSPEKIDAIALSGNGEPTLHPFFPEALDAVLKARDLYLPNVPVSVFTNGANLEQRRIIDALNRADERMVKIDAGNDRVLKAINGPLARTSVSKILAGMRNLKDVIVQSFFVQGLIDNTQPTDIEDWIEVIGLIGPKAVHIHGMSRVPSVRGLTRVDEDTLYTIASKLERRTQIRSLVFP